MSSARSTRRRFLAAGAGTVGALAFGPAFWRSALAEGADAGPSPYGPLQPADANGLRLPAGFRSRIVARANEPVAGTGYPWHIFPDGGATFPLPGGGWALTSNSESLAAGGAGTSAIRFGPDGTITGAYRILAGTNANCAGGPTPWGAWLSCEEHDGGHVWECDPTRGAGRDPPRDGDVQPRGSVRRPDEPPHLHDRGQARRRALPLHPRALSQPRRGAARRCGRRRRRQCRLPRGPRPERDHRPDAHPGGRHEAVQRRRGHLVRLRVRLRLDQGRQPRVGPRGAHRAARGALRPRGGRTGRSAARGGQPHGKPGGGDLRLRGRRQQGDLPHHPGSRRGAVPAARGPGRGRPGRPGQRARRGLR